MITQALFDAVLTFVGSIIDNIMSQMQLPVGAHIDIPDPLFFLFQDTFAYVAQIYPLLFGWYIWRQIKA